MNPATCQKVLSRSIARHPAKDGRVWILRVNTIQEAATVYSQPTLSHEDTLLNPIVEVMNEFEAEANGLGMRAGDLRLTLPGDVDLHLDSILLCNDKRANIFKIDPDWQGGVIQQQKVYVRRMPEE